MTHNWNKECPGAPPKSAKINNKPAIPGPESAPGEPGAHERRAVTREGEAATVATIPRAT